VPRHRQDDAVNRRLCIGGWCAVGVDRPALGYQLVLRTALQADRLRYDGVGKPISHVFLRAG